MRILFANDGADDPGGVRTYLDATMMGMRNRGHSIAFLYVDITSAGAPGKRYPWAQLIPANATEPAEAFRAVEAWAPDVCFSNNMRHLAIERGLLARLPVVKFMHNYNGTCLSGSKSFLLPAREPCRRTCGPACLALYLPRRCGGLDLREMAVQYEWSREQRRLFQDYDAIVVASRHMYREFLDNGADERSMHLNPLFADGPVIHRDTPAPQEFTILFLARMTNLKGGDLLIQATAGASSAIGRRIRLVMAGDGPRRMAWQTLADRLGVAADFVGWVDEDRRDELIQSASVVAVPSTWPEPFGLTGLEAARFGLPAVAFDVGGVREWLRDGVSGRIVPGKRPDHASLARALVELADDPTLLSRCRSGARVVASELTLDRHLDALESLLTSAAVSTLDDRARRKSDGPGLQSKSSIS